MPFWPPIFVLAAIFNGARMIKKPFQSALAQISLCVIGLLFLANPAVSDTKIVGGIGSYIFHNDAFDSLISSFVGSYSPSNQMIWNSVVIDNSSVVGSGAGSGSGVTFYPINSIRFGVARDFENALKSGLDLEIETSVNSTTYYFPDGILPVIDPLYLDITSLDIDAYLSKSMPLATVGRVDFGVNAGVGVVGSALSSRLEWVFWDARDSILLADPYVRGALQIGWEAMVSEVSVTRTLDGNSQIQFSYRVEM